MDPEAPALVPELLVADISRSLDFWCGPCGFVIEYQREEEGSAYISRGSAHVMLDQISSGRNWVTAPLERPLGRGINFEISIPDLSPVLSALRNANVQLFLEPEIKWYRVSPIEETGVRQFFVTDPDGYLLRFQTSLGNRLISDAPG